MADDDTPDQTDDTPDAPEAPTPPAAKDAAEPYDEGRYKSELSKKNSEAANLRKRLKELEPLATKAKELEDASKTESQRLTEERDGHKSRADKAEAAHHRMQVALDRAPEGATLAHVKTVAKRLTGDSDEEMEADADELFGLFVTDAKPKTSPPPGRPREQLRGGGDPDEEPEETDPRKIAAQISR